MRHIRGQPYSALTMQLIKDLVAGNITSVSQRMNWFETQAMHRAMRQWVYAAQQAERGAWEKAEQLLLVVGTTKYSEQNHVSESGQLLAQTQRSTCVAAPHTRSPSYAPPLGVGNMAAQCWDSTRPPSLKCYSALEVQPCGTGLSVYSEPDK